MRVSATLVDANVLLRVLLLDDEKGFQAAKQFLMHQPEASCRLTAAVLAEIIYVMLGAGYLRPSIAEAISDLMEHDALAYDETCLSRSLEIYGSTGLDFVDCYLIARSLQTGEALQSFDRPLLKKYQKLLLH